MKRNLSFLPLLLFFAVACWAASGYDDVVKLVKSGASPDVIISFINTSGESFALTSDQIVKLKAMGASDKVLVAALRRARPAETTVAQPKETSKSAASATPAMSSVVVPSTGGWVLMNGYWYWEYPTGVIVDLGWQPYYWHSNWWFFRNHWGRRRRW